MPYPRESLPLNVEQQRIIRQIESTFLFMAADPDDEAASRPWLTWQLEGMLPHITLASYTPAELMAHTALTGMCFSRRLVQHPTSIEVGLRRPSGLRLV